MAAFGFNVLTETIWAVTTQGEPKIHRVKPLSIRKMVSKVQEKNGSLISGNLPKNTVKSFINIYLIANWSHAGRPIRGNNFGCAWMRQRLGLSKDRLR